MYTGLHKIQRLWHAIIIDKAFYETTGGIVVCWGLVDLYVEGLGEFT